MAEFDTTKFINIDDEDFVGYYNTSKEPNGYTIKVGEIRMFPKFLAEHFAIHLIDKLLQKKGIKDTKRDTPIRRSLFTQVIPDIMIDVPELKTLNPQEEIAEIKKIVDSQQKMVESSIKATQESINKEIAKDKLISDLVKKVAELEKSVSQKKGGRPKKSESSVE